MREILGDEFDYAAHRVVGSADDARSWIERSALPEEDARALHRLIDRFPGLTFYRDDLAMLDHLEWRNKVALPQWLLTVRQVLAGPGPNVKVRFDGFDNERVRRMGRMTSDGPLPPLYKDRSFGYLEEEDRDLLMGEAGCYPLLSASTHVEYILAANLADPEDPRIVDLCDEDIADAVSAGDPGVDHVRPAFDSYARMLSRIAECHLLDGTVVRARGLSTEGAEGTISSETRR